MRSFEEDRVFIRPSSWFFQVWEETLWTRREKRSSGCGKLRSIEPVFSHFCDGRHSTTSFRTSRIVSSIFGRVCSRLFVFVQRQISTVFSGCALGRYLCRSRDDGNLIKTLRGRNARGDENGGRENETDKERWWAIIICHGTGIDSNNIFGDDWNWGRGVNVIHSSYSSIFSLTSNPSSVKVSSTK